MVLHMRRTQVLIPDELHGQAARVARSRGISMGHLVREALAQYLETSGALPSPEAIDRVLLAPPHEDPNDDPRLSVDVDFYLYDAPRKSGVHPSRLYAVPVASRVPDSVP
jgi:hypothetical protein